ncbi:MAG: hypothetical protein JST75_09190 [Bacteroidetes bacterium]|nr:hypothetical protein [Bacteroidota bacterium]
MHQFDHFSVLLLLLLLTTTAIYSPQNFDQSLNKSERIFPFTHSQVVTVTKKKCNWYILLNPEGISNKEGNSIKFKNFKRSLRTSSFNIKLENNERMILESKKVWGYEGSDCTIYRNFETDFLRIEENGSLIVYSRKIKGFKGRLITVYYFSKTLRGPVFSLDKDNIAEQFKDDACFLSKVIKRLSWTNNYSAWDSKKSTFVITEIMNECK